MHLKHLARGQGSKAEARRTAPRLRVEGRTASELTTRDKMRGEMARLMDTTEPIHVVYRVIGARQRQSRVLELRAD